MNDPKHEALYAELSTPCRCVYPDKCFCKPAQKASAASPSLADRLRDVDEQNALVVRRRAADRIEELEAELVEQRSFLLSEVHRAEDERDAERHRAVAAETRLIRGR